jgi:5'-nucleotidase (lipoprotein e(P4) family)
VDRMRLLALLAAFACAPVAPVVVAPSPSPPSPPAATTQRVPREIHWVRTAAEHDALFHQIFRSARERLVTLVAGRRAGSWAVIADADETLIDNSEYQRRRIPFGGTFDSASWNAWVRERSAAPLPGAVEYVAAVRALGGRVIVVTNRDQVVCDDTRANLSAIRLSVDLVLCRTTTSDKNPRFETVQSGAASPQLPALEVIQWLGDNIQDFPRLTQVIRGGGPATFALFGDRYFVLPNPMYGSFENNRAR